MFYQYSGNSWRRRSVSSKDWGIAGWWTCLCRCIFLSNAASSSISKMTVLETSRYRGVRTMERSVTYSSTCIYICISIQSFSSSKNCWLHKRSTSAQEFFPQFETIYTTPALLFSCFGCIRLCIYASNANVMVFWCLQECWHSHNFSFGWIWANIAESSE